MLIKHIVVEARIAYCKACKLARVSVRIPTTIDCGRDQSILQKFFIKEASVSAQVANQVANFGTNVWVLVRNKYFQVVVDVGVVDWLVKVLVDARQLRNERERVHDQVHLVVAVHQFVLRDSG